MSAMLAYYQVERELGWEWQWVDVAADRLDHLARRASAKWGTAPEPARRLIFGVL